MLPASQIESLSRLVEAYNFDFSLIRVADYEILSSQNRLLYFQFKRSRYESLRSLDSFLEYDPLSYLMTTFLHLQKDEQIVYQLVIEPAPLGARGMMLQAAGKVATASLQALGGPLEGGSTQEAKAQQPLFKASLRLLISSPSRAKSLRYETSLLATFGLFNQAAGQSLQAVFRNKKRYYEAFSQRLLLRYSKDLLLSAEELANLYHLPSHLNLNSAFLPYLRSRQLPLTPQLQRQDNQVVLGENYYQGRRQLIGLTEEMRRRHLYIVGATGTGKTTLIQAQALADIAAGRGLAVIDPHGDLAQYLLQRIPAQRKKDLIYFNPFDEKSQLGINLLSLPEDLEGDALEQAKDLRTEALISVLRKVFKIEEGDIGHRVEYVLRNTIQTSFSVLEPNIFTLFKILNDPLYNRKLLLKLEDPYLKMFWRNEIGRAGGMQKVKMQAGVTAKIGRFIFSTVVKRAFNKTSEECLNISEIINGRKVLICNFAKGLLGEDASLLFSATVLAQIQLVLLEQVRLDPKRRPDFYLYVDEFQHFATSSFKEMLAEARKYGLNLIMAQQSMQQQADYKLTEAILANVGNIVVFRTGSNLDTKLLAPLFSPQLDTSDFMNLPSYHFYIKIHAQEVYPPISGVTRVQEA